MKSKLHYSWLQTLLQCGERYRRRYVENEIIPPSIAIKVGKGVHKSVETNLKHKCKQGGVLLPADSVADIARDTVNTEWQAEGGILLTDEEKTVGEEKLKGEAVDKAVRLASVHHATLAPGINPVSEDHVERKWVITSDQLAVDLQGTIDVVELNAVRDTKTSAKSPAADAAHDSDQLTMYALAFYAENGRLPDLVALDYLVDLKTPKGVTVTSQRTLADFQTLLNRVDVAVKAVNTGVFLPTNQSNWWCNPRWCGYAPTCRYYRQQRG